MCVGRGPTPDAGGGVFGKGDVGSLLVVVPVRVLDCMLGCAVFGSRWDTMAPILCENMEEEAERKMERTLKACSPDLIAADGSATDTRAVPKVKGNDASMLDKQHPHQI
jgi:hypothetical protein